jgi:parallel beta-helix repeat protein
MTVLRLADGANCPVIIMGEAVNNPKNTIKDLRVADLSIDGNRRNQQRELWKLQGEGSHIRNNGITVQTISDSTVEHVTTARCRSGGVVTTLGVRRLTVRDLNSYDNEFDGLACYLTEDSTFADLFLHDNPGAGISLDLSFNNNTVHNALLSANDLGIFMRSSRGNEFEDVAIRNCHHFGVFMAHTERKTANGWQAAPSSECVKNSFKGIVASNCGGAAFRVNNSTCTNNVIVHAKFDENLKGGLSLAGPDLITVQ